MKPIVVFDLETTGLDRTKDSIIQFAAIKMDRETNKLIDSLNLYIQPEGTYNISLQAYFKHGITAKFLSDKPYFRDVYKQILDFIEDCDLLTYNGCNFDTSASIYAVKNNKLSHIYKKPTNIDGNT